MVAEIFYMGHPPWDYGVEFHQVGQNIEVTLQPIPTAEIKTSLQAAHNEPCLSSIHQERSQSRTSPPYRTPT